MASRGVDVTERLSSWATKAICLRTCKLLAGSTCALLSRISACISTPQREEARPAKILSSDVLPNVYAMHVG